MNLESTTADLVSAVRISRKTLTVLQPLSSCHSPIPATTDVTVENQDQQMPVSTKVNVKYAIIWISLKEYFVSITMIFS